MINTDESIISYGSMSFAVYNEENGFTSCTVSSASSIGTNGKGGVFNCGVTGTRFQITCTSCGENYYGLTAVRLWKYKAVSSEPPTTFPLSLLIGTS